MSDFYHLGFDAADLGGRPVRTAIISGDPARAERVATRFLSKSQLLSDHRGLKFYLAELENGEPVLSATSGMGAPSISIIINELAQLGLKKIIRVGTTGAIQSGIDVGDIVISQASLCRQGASLDIAPVEFPAAADIFLTKNLVDAATELKIPFHLGLTASVDTFYEGQGRQDSANPHLLRRLQGLTEEYRNLGILNYEMESGTFFKMGLVYKFQAACVCGVVAQRLKGEKVDESKIHLAEERAILTAIKALSL